MEAFSCTFAYLIPGYGGLTARLSNYSMVQAHSTGWVGRDFDFILVPMRVFKRHKFESNGTNHGHDNCSLKNPQQLTKQTRQRAVRLEKNSPMR